MRAARAALALGMFTVLPFGCQSTDSNEVGLADGSPRADVQTVDSPIDSPADSTMTSSRDASENSLDTGPDSSGDSSLDSGVTSADANNEEPDTSDEIAETGPDVDAGAGADADADAGADADANDGESTASIILTQQGASCEACAVQKCLNTSLSCEGIPNQVADGGPSAGVSRQALCDAALACILDTTAACYNQGTLEACLCGPILNPTCESSGPLPTAACTAQEEDGLETTDPTVALDRYYDGGYGAGMANNIALCIGNNCIDCWP